MHVIAWDKKNQGVISHVLKTCIDIVAGSGGGEANTCSFALYGCMPDFCKPIFSLGFVFFVVQKLGIR